MGRIVPGGVHGTALLKNATVPACLVEDVPCSDPAALLRADVEIADGRLARFLPTGSDAGGLPVHDLDGGLVLPTLVDLHTHLDKGHIWPRKANPDGSFVGALNAVGEDRIANWTADDVRTRMEFALKCAYAHGTSAIRTHIDSLPPQEEISWPIFEELRQEWSGRIELQGVCLFGIDRLQSDAAYLEAIADRMVTSGGIMGAVTYMIPDLDRHLEAVFRAAMARGLDLDFHVDETLDPKADTLRHIAETALRLGFDGRIVCGHCCSLSVQAEAEADHTLDLLAESGIAVVSLPMCNIYLQDRRAGRTPRRRGVTLLHEMRARGIPVVVSSDNTRDPFYAYGDLDLVEVYTQATRILHLDHPIADWIDCVTKTPAGIMGLSHGQLKAGGTADLILFNARDWNELLSRPAGPREVLRKGVSIDGNLPDYRELDHLMMERQA
ncbi:cytosine deaminase [Roseibium aggregatum]|uniref:Cytosine deaminase n=1 Tax=Roseibium aggregatum TaxID=187304 RepID=A0A939EGG4_9HYPH|nr:cytosine deaminase [Roseibium aggregatum]MBN9671094.1 cytosine deaminase [Roseibium aggregatum]